MEEVVAVSGGTADTPGRCRDPKKAGDKFYKMDEESIVTIREELSEDFFSLAEAHLSEVRGLVENLDDFTII